MKKNLKVMALIFMVMMIVASCQGKTAETAKSENESSKVALSNDIFSVQVPEKFDGQYNTEVNDHTINFYDKECISNGNPGWIFGIQVFENPSDWAYGPVAKIGELNLNSGKLYDVVISYPTESQFGFNEDGSEVKMPQEYKSFYDARYDIAATVTGKNGEKVDIGAGTKGENLYKDILDKHITAIKENWDSSKLEDENMSTMYNQMADGDTNVLDKVGFAYRDINSDGIDELLIGEIADEDWKGIIYDLYTMVDRKPAHVVSGWDRNRYFDYEDNFIVNEGSGGADETDTILYALGGNEAKLVFQLAFKYDGYTDEKKPWFKAYSQKGDDYDWQPYTEDEFNKDTDRYSKHIDPGYKALSTIDS